MKAVRFKNNQRRRQLRALNRKINLRNRVYYRVVLATVKEQEMITEYKWEE